MKKSILGSLIGVAIVMALDSFVRVVISVYMREELYMISYYQQLDLVWPIALTIMAGLTVFVGALFSLTYGRKKRAASVILYITLIALLRYGQIYLLTGRESIFYPITALVLSLTAIFLAWHLLSKNKTEVKETSGRYHEPDGDF